MGQLQLTQIERRVKQAILPYLNVSDLGQYQPEDRDRILLSRSLAAFIVSKLGDLDPQAAAQTITDGAHDNGIDALAVVPEEARLIVVQAKWSTSGKGSAERDEMIKLRDGLKDLVQMRWSRFNDKVQSRKAELEDLLDQPKARIDIAFVHSGASPCTDDVRAPIQDFLDDLNDPTETGRFHYYSQAEIHQLLLNEGQSPRITISGELSDWGQLEGPPRAFYGQVTAKQISEWFNQHGESLFAKNVRVVLGGSEVNDSLVETLTNDAGSFWYFNNGITVLCESVEKSPVYGADRRVGNFTFSGASVVNGAQTVGSIARAAQRSELDQARVMVRFISLEGAPPEFANSVTRATNTQNRIGGRDFLSLDPEQARLRSEFGIEGLEYVYRSGEADPEPAKGCSVVEATIALACAQPEVGLSTQAKREISRLWDAIDRGPYKRLFNPSVDFHRVWRAVQIMRQVDGRLREISAQSDGRERGVAIHGNRFLLHIVFSQLPINKLDDAKFDWMPHIGLAQAWAQLAFAKTVEVSDAEFPGYPASLFKNVSKCTALAARVKTELQTGFSGSPQ
ncbi:AIPR family protein [Micromonospora sp. NPDC000316]|uniref:AIPR family protein n=1 Tax=Micromonospora sp. NPDC000316 TaxID=3364216 RepID=UPI0036BFB0E2